MHFSISKIPKSFLPRAVLIVLTPLLLLNAVSSHAQLKTVCDNKPNYVRLASLLGPPTGFGGNYETEICGILLYKKYTSPTFAIEINGKAGSGMGIYSMNCTNKPMGIWTSELTINGHKKVIEKMLPDALNQAANAFC